MSPSRVRAGRWGMYWLPRALHPVAWWLWALGLAVAASRTTNPLLLVALLVAVSSVVLARRSDAPWAAAFGMYLAFAGFVVAVRVLFRIIFGGGGGGVVLVPLPRFDLPGASEGIHLLGDITAESLLGGLYDGLRLAAMLVCLGAANCLANPRRLLRSLPPALHEVSTALVVAVSVFPQLAESVLRVRAARLLRPDPDRRRVARLRGILIPVLEDALERSLALAASMDSRGYGRSGARSRRAGLTVGALMVVGLSGVCVGVYALLDTTTPRYLATPMLAGGVLLGLGGVGLSGRGVRRSVYRPDRWRLAELLTVASGAGCAAVVALAAAADPGGLHPSLYPLEWPTLPLLALAGVLVGLLPAVLAPRPAPVEAGRR